MQAAQFGAFVQANQGYALCGAAKFTDFADAGAHQHALVGDQHDFVVDMNQCGCNNLTVALALLNSDHALGTTAMARVLSNASALAVAVFGCSEHALLLVLGD